MGYIDGMTSELVDAGGVPNLVVNLYPTFTALDHKPITLNTKPLTQNSKPSTPKAAFMKHADGKGDGGASRMVSRRLAGFDTMERIAQWRRDDDNTIGVGQGFGVNV